MKTYGRVKVKVHTFLILVLDREQWSVSRFDRFILLNSAPDNRLIKVRMDLNAMANRKFLAVGKN